ncbi:MAG: AAA family ATPase [Candidatus Thermoplasmatota archaeon]|nr:AAA family ATPase [Candidatus Thermoplasmatota archaeon]
MKRLIDKKLREWKDSGRRKPLIVRGVRQVGKTYSIAQFGAQNFENLATVDLERNKDLHGIFTADLDPKRILSELEIFLDVKLTPGKTLLFLDEIQSCPEAIMALRYFYEEWPELHVVAAGSLLEFALHETSFPVGRVQFLEMHPMSFLEYLWGLGRDEAAKIIASSPRALPETTHRLLLKELRNYFFVGGMPESVGAYVETGSLHEVFRVHRDLVESFRHDFSKYNPRVDGQCLDGVLTAVALNVGKQVTYTRLMEGFSHHTIKRAFDALCMARLITKVPSSSPRGLPLATTVSPKKFKATMVDVGFWQHLCGVKIDTEYAKSNLLDMYRGAMAEQFVGQEMLVAQDSQLYYWARSAKGSTAEVDYLGTVDDTIIPVEVKSGAAGRLRSLHLLLQSFPQIPRGVVLSTRMYSELPNHRLVFIPIYYAYSATGGSA